VLLSFVNRINRLLSDGDVVIMETNCDNYITRLIITTITSNATSVC